MPAIFAPIAIFLGRLVVPILGRVLFALGFGVVTYVGLRVLTNEITSIVIGQFDGLASDVAALLSSLNIDRAITVILSAYAARFALRAVMGATRKITSLGD